jgi:hypothetical protein
MPTTKHAILQAVSEYNFPEGIPVNFLFSDALELKPDMEISDFDRTLKHLIKENYVVIDDMKVDSGMPKIGILPRIEAGNITLTGKGDIEL